MPNQPEPTLLERTKQLVVNAPRSVKFTEMAKETGVSISWISRFAADKIPNPGIHHVQALFDYLTGLEG